MLNEDPMWRLRIRFDSLQRVLFKSLLLVSLLVQLPLLPKTDARRTLQRFHPAGHYIVKDAAGEVYVSTEGDDKLTPLYQHPEGSFENLRISRPPISAQAKYRNSANSAAVDNSLQQDDPDKQPEPKNYAFAYAVRDLRDGASTGNGGPGTSDDFSHKESRDGEVTMGEYKVLLPDGRLQVVRYTADAKAGFKADVTYEGQNAKIEPEDSQQNGLGQNQKQNYEPLKESASYARNTASNSILSPSVTPAPSYFSHHNPSVQNGQNGHYHGQNGQPVQSISNVNVNLNQPSPPRAHSTVYRFISPPSSSSSQSHHSSSGHHHHHHLNHHFQSQKTGKNHHFILSSPTQAPGTIYRLAQIPRDQENTLISLGADPPPHLDRPSNSQESQQQQQQQQNLQQNVVEPQHPSQSPQQSPYRPRIIIRPLKSYQNTGKPSYYIKEHQYLGQQSPSQLPSSGSASNSVEYTHGSGHNQNAIGGGQSPLILVKGTPTTPAYLIKGPRRIVKARRLKNIHGQPLNNLASRFESLYRQGRLVSASAPPQPNSQQSNSNEDHTKNQNGGGSSSNEVVYYSNSPTPAPQTAIYRFVSPSSRSPIYSQNNIIDNNNDDFGNVRYPSPGPSASPTHAPGGSKELANHFDYSQQLPSPTPAPQSQPRKRIIISPRPSQQPSIVLGDNSDGSKSSLIPIEFFKAGPASGPKSVQSVFVANKQFAKLRSTYAPIIIQQSTPPSRSYLHQQQQQQQQIIHESEQSSDLNPILNFESNRGGGPSSIPSSIIDNSLHNNHQHHTEHLPPIKSSVATYTSTIGHLNQPSPKPILYIKSRPKLGVGRAIRPSVGGLVYLETPAHGERPTALGVKETLARLQTHNYASQVSISPARTTTHPYEIGASDYGQSVGYSISRELDGDKQPGLSRKIDHLESTQQQEQQQNQQHYSQIQHLSYPALQNNQYIIEQQQQEEPEGAGSSQDHQIIEAPLSSDQNQNQNQNSESSDDQNLSPSELQLQNVEILKTNSRSSSSSSSSPSSSLINIHRNNQYQDQLNSQLITQDLNPNNQPPEEEVQYYEEEIQA